MGRQQKKQIDVIETILQEWAWRCDKGYPDINNPKDKTVLEHLLNSLSEEQEKDQYNFLETLPLPSEDISIIEQVFSSLSDNDKQKIKKNFRIHTLTSFRTFIKDNYNTYKEFFNISKKKGRGRGEFIPLMCLKDSISQGTEDKDILIGNIVLEIKELDEGGKFLTGKSGSIKKTEFSILIETYCKYLSDLDIKDNASVDFVINYFQNQYVSGNVSNDFINKIQDTVKTISKLDVEDLQETDQNYIKIGDKRFSYTFEKGTKAEPGASVILGKELQKAEISLIKLKKHPIYKNVDIIYEKYDDVVNKYLSYIDYFGIYKINGNTPPTVYSSSELKTELRKNYISTVQHNLRLQIK